MTAKLPPPAADKAPLFIVGSMRSGTTWLRDMLRRVPNLICPEETHFMRWAEPFRTPSGMTQHRNNALLRKHREMDGVDEEVFDLILGRSQSKGELQRRYISAFAAAKGVEAPFRWFDKTPQNIYGLPLIMAEFPRARILHLVRNPLNVVASLQLGRQVSIPDLQGAINCWTEAVEIWDAVAGVASGRTREIRYEDILADAPGCIAAILEFAQVDHAPGLWTPKDAQPEKNQWRKVLSHEAALRVARRCDRLATPRGYDLMAQVKQCETAG
ncbi:sulfotransferase family protein [Gymnodinialimonas ceratoperidinii]|uniref:Sulfotransferase n=1 Tax=Gymnodinialimonas ceratoperidinii TaxID=2856823 RepID=A0A8F6YAY0_9RHOB|nr:sulfotransferase [Gymnodinialimonas ceratoperidinii]QXT40404.1 sulfotransferase [Gymnodinialimonas ceratoperidinii]